MGYFLVDHGFVILFSLQPVEYVFVDTSIYFIRLSISVYCYSASFAEGKSVAVLSAGTFLGNSRNVYQRRVHELYIYSALLSYMLYDCKTDEVLLEKEVDMVKNYINLEKERHGDKIDISINIEGDIQDKYITPLLILPFLENAFKYGTSEQLERQWMSVDIAVKDHLLQCKVVNSKNEFLHFQENGLGVDNVKKRLEFLYPDRHDLKLADEGDFFVVSLLLELRQNLPSSVSSVFSKQSVKDFAHEIAPIPKVG